jgi:hypothetical protein
MYNLKYTLPKHSDFKVAGGLPFLIDWGQGEEFLIFYH